MSFAGPDRIPTGFEVNGTRYFGETYGNDIVSVAFSQHKETLDKGRWRDEWGCEWEAITSTVCEVKNQVLDNPDYPAFVGAWKQENERCRQALEQGEKTVFGPVRYTVDQYYSYRQNNLEIKLVRAFEQEFSSTLTPYHIELLYLQNRQMFNEQPL